MQFGKLNSQQRQAVECLKGPLLVLAGAGTGKTTVITCRVARLLAAGVPPEAILAVTFTNKAAREMRTRLARMAAPATADKLTVATFHSFCCRVLRSHIPRLGYRKGFGIADDGDQDGLLREIMGELSLDGSDGLDAGYFRRGISDAKANLRGPEAAAAMGRGPRFKLLGDVYERYQTRLKCMNLLDFDDLLLLTVRLWDAHPDVLEEYRQRYQCLLVDEYQDTNVVQAELLRRLAAPRNNICVVGDDDQSIYGWRGANPQNILEFHLQYRGAKIVKLEENYRSTPLILEAANGLIAHNAARHGKDLRSIRDTGEQLLLVETATETEEARLVVRLLSDHHVRLRMPYGDMGVLCRSNHQTRLFEQGLRESNVPYRLVGAKSFYERREIRDACAYLRIVHNPVDELSLLRVLNVPPRGVGEVAVERLHRLQQATGKPLLALLSSTAFLEALPAGTRKEMTAFVAAYDRARNAFTAPGQLANKVETYLEDIGYLAGLKRIYRNEREALSRRENIAEFVSAASLLEERTPEAASLQGFLETFSLADDNDRVESHGDAEAGGVTLMTVHAAKGLEFPLVCVVGLEQGLFPHDRALKDYTVEEERRLFYVALTRAKTHLLLTYAKTRTRFGNRLRMRPSQFLAELPEQTVRRSVGAAALRPATRDEINNVVAEMLARFS